MSPSGGQQAASRLSLYALGAAATIPVIVAASEQPGFGSKLAGYLASTFLPSAQQALPAAGTALERLSALLEEASQALERAGQAGSAPPGGLGGMAACMAYGQGWVDVNSNPVLLLPPPILASRLLTTLPRAEPEGQTSAAAMLAASHRQAPLHYMAPLEHTAAALAAATAAAVPRRLEGSGLLDVADDAEVAAGSTAAGATLAAAAAATAPRFQHVHAGPAAALSAARPADVAAMRRCLEEDLGLEALPERFSDAELMRYAITKGYLRARSDEERGSALRQVCAGQRRAGRGERARGGRKRRPGW